MASTKVNYGLGLQYDFTWRWRWIPVINLARLKDSNGKTLRHVRTGIHVTNVPRIEDDPCPFRHFHSPRS